jgi:hypothetical protein
MATHALSPEEAADRLAIRELIGAYTHCTVRRDAGGQKAYFTPATHFVIHADARSDKPARELRGRESLTSAFKNLNNFQTTMHFNG